MHKNIEFKARCENPANIKSILRLLGADYRGRDNQIDTYFNVPEDEGRLKIREGNIEKALISYQRPDFLGVKESDVDVRELKPDNPFKRTLTLAYGVKVVVEKQRDIYFIGNVKFHIDQVSGLEGFFVEVEAIDKDGTIGTERLREQCDHYKNLFGIVESMIVAESYSDLLLKKQI